MPYAKISELPSAVKSALPAHGQHIYAAAFNAFAKDNPGKDESHAHAVAWAAVKRKYRKKGDTWTKVSDAVSPITHFDFYDDVELIDSKPQFTSDGYMKAFARVARTGIQVYKGAELGRPSMDEVRVYRPPEEVFAADAMKSLAHRPLTLHHPRENVSSKNWRHYAVGYTGEDVVRDGDHVRVPLMLCDQATIDAVTHDGIKQLSVGYSADVDWTPGVTPGGERYHAIQSNIRANHQAIVPDARGGEKLDILSDANRNHHRHTGQFTHGESRMDKKTCPECGTKATADADECKDCGHVFGGGQHFGDDDTPMTTCWSCGQAIPESTEICPLCRERQDVSSDDRGDEIKTEEDLHNAIKALYRGKGFSANKVRIIKAAKKLGKVRKLPEDWNIANSIGDVAIGDANVFDKEFSTERRRKLAKAGKAMPHGGYPIESRADLGRAIQAFGRAKDPAATKRWIIKRARALGATKDLPEDWNVRDSKGARTMNLIIDGAVIEFDDATGTIVKQLLDARAADKSKIDKLKADMEEMSKDARKRDQDYSSGKHEETANEEGGGQQYDEDGDEDGDDWEKEMKRGAKQRKEDRRDSRDSKDGQIAALKKQLADARKASSVDALDQRVADRQSVIDAARPLLDRSYNPAGKSNDQVRRDAVAAQGIDVTKMNDAAVSGAFAALTLDRGQNNQNGYGRMVDGMTRSMAMSDRDMLNQRSNMQRDGVSGASMRDAAFDARERYLNTAWQGQSRQDAHGNNTNDFRRQH